ncbi:hypothetical protein BKA57DRAFT_469860 [Linnemannia elongata]|nr:hypothetical protein BKA57DRAFT_469860 [Linnemannia elongata]
MQGVSVFFIQLLFLLLYALSHSLSRCGLTITCPIYTTHHCYEWMNGTWSYTKCINSCKTNKQKHKQKRTERKTHIISRMHCAC